jgi:hypothetical protein
MAQLLRSANVRNLMHTACSQDQPRKCAQGRFDSFAKPFANDRCLLRAVVHFVVFAWVGILPNRGPASWRRRLEAFAIPESQSDAVAEGIEKVVLAVTSSVANAKALDLVEQVISRVPLVDNRLLEGSVRVLDQSAMHIT